MPRGVSRNRRPGSQLPGRTPPPGLGRDPWEEQLEQQLPAHALAESTVSALIMYHDLLVLTRRDSTFVTPLLTPSNLIIDWAATEWTLARNIRFNWPGPPVTTFFDLDCLKSAWNRAIKSLDVIGETLPLVRVERLLFAWISAGTAVLTRTSAVPLSHRSEAVPWPGVIGKLQDLTTTSSRQLSDAAREWLLRVAEVLMPELAAPSSVQELFSKAKPLTTFWRLHRLAVQERRRERLDDLVLAAIDRRACGQPQWAERPRARVRARPNHAAGRTFFD